MPPPRGGRKTLCAPCTALVTTSHAPVQPPQPNWCTGLQTKPSGKGTDTRIGKSQRVSNQKDARQPGAWTSPSCGKWPLCNEPDVVHPFLGCLTTTPNPCLRSPWMSSLSGKHESTFTHVPGPRQGIGGAQHACPCFPEYNFCTQTGKRHGRSSGMRHGWRSSGSGVRTPVRPSVQGPVGEAPATAPFSIPLHHRYRRCDGWRVSSIFPNPPTPSPPTPRGSETHTHTKNEAPGTAHLQQRAPSLLPPSAGWRMSSSYSSSACPRKRTRTGVFRAAVSCATAPPCCAKPDESLVPQSLHPSCLPLHECFPCMSEIIHKKKRGTKHGTPAAARPVTATGVRRVARFLLVVLLCLPAEEDSNSGLQGTSWLHGRCTTLRKPSPP